jgi:hypothetical protein
MLVRRRLRQWGMVWGAMALCGSIVLGAQFRQMSEERAKSAVLADRVRPLHAIQAATRAATRRSQAVSKQAASLRNLQAPDRSLALLAILGDAARATDRQLQIQQLSVKAAVRHAAPVKTARGASPTTRTSAQATTVSLRGIAANDLVLARFIETLRSAAVFDDVELTSFTQSGVQAIATRQFQVECRFAE